MCISPSVSESKSISSSDSRTSSTQVSTHMNVPNQVPEGLWNQGEVREVRNRVTLPREREVGATADHPDPAFRAARSFVLVASSKQSCRIPPCGQTLLAKFQNQEPQFKKCLEGKRASCALRPSPTSPWFHNPSGPWFWTFPYVEVLLSTELSTALKPMHLGALCRPTLRASGRGGQL